MTEDRFWQLIKDARHGDDFYATLRETLTNESADDIISFQNILRRKLVDAYTFPVLMANFVIQSYVSDDVFEDFRAWLVTQGRERFESALTNPDSICDWFVRDDVDGIDGETMLLICQNAYEQYGDEDEFFEHLHYPPEPTVNQDWPDDKDGFRDQCPRLVDNFWNQERIKELHSD